MENIYQCKKQKKCYKKWNFPAGHLDFNESLEQGAISIMKNTSFENICELEKLIIRDTLEKIIINKEYLQN